MSKYEELRDAYVAARSSYFASRDASSAFAAVLVQGLEKYLGSPDFQMHFLPASGDVSSAKLTTSDTAVWLGPDARWHFSVGLPLTDRKQGVHKGGSTQTLVFELHVAAQDGGFSVGLKGWPELFTVPATAGAPEHNALFEFLFDKMAEVYKRPGLKFHDNMADTRRPVAE
jgi:hypothetical protein